MKCKGLFALFSIFIFSGFGSCSSSIQTACTESFPRFESEIRYAMTAMVDTSGGRSLASVSSQNERKKWGKWSEERLREVQGYLDVIETQSNPSMGRSAAKEELSQVANELVTLSGYMERGRTLKIIATLQRIQGHGRQARLLACGITQ